MLWLAVVKNLPEQLLENKDRPGLKQGVRLQLWASYYLNMKEDNETKMESFFFISSFFHLLSRKSDLPVDHPQECPLPQTPDNLQERENKKN